jgi:hypothetical protein
MKKVELVFDRLSVDWTPEEDEAFNEVERQSNLGKQILQEINDEWRKNASEYERGFVDGMQKQMQSSVDKAVNAMSQRKWVGLTEEDLKPICDEWRIVYGAWMDDFARDIEDKLKEKNHAV